MPRILIAWMMHGILVDMGKMLWGEIQETHKRAGSHSNAGDVEDPICARFVHMGKGV